MVKVLIINAYSAQNRGDAGIVVAMVHIVRELCPSANIKVMSSFASANFDFYQKYNVESIPAIWVLGKNESALTRYLKGISFFIKTKLNPNSKIFKHYKDADIILSAGGGYLYSSKRGPLGFGLLSTLFHYWVGKQLNKPVIAFPQSVGPLNYYVDKLIVRHVLSKVDLFFSREEISTSLLKCINLNNILQVPDVAFTLPNHCVNLAQINMEKSKGFPYIGVTVLDWRFSRKGSSPHDINNYLKKLVNVLQYFLNKFEGSHIYIFPQVTVGEGDSDILVSKKLNQYLSEDRSTVVNFTEHITPEQIVNVYSKMDLFIGSRLHSTIFALAGGVKAISLAYQPKTTGTFKLLNLQDRCFDIKEFSEDDLKSCLEKLLNDNDAGVSDDLIRDIRNKLENNLSRFF